MLEEATAYCQKYKLLNEFEKLVISRMSSSETGLMNWQYGDTYFSVSPDTAKKYDALLNKYRSEFVSTIMNLDKKIATHEIGFQYTCKIHNDFAEYMRKASPKPIILSVYNVEIKKMACENGELNLYEAVEKIDKIYSKWEKNMNEFYIRVDNRNFRIATTIAWEKIICEYI